MKKITRLLRTAVLPLSLTAAIALGGGAARAQTPPEDLAISYVPSNVGSWDILVAIEKGIFAKEGFAAHNVILQSAIQSAQLMVTNAVQMAVAQSVGLLSAITHGAKETAIIAAPMNRPDWVLYGRPEVKTAADLKGKLVGTASLQAGETWLARDWIIGHGLPQSEWGMIIVGTSAAKFAALQRGSIAATILFQPLGFEAEEKGFSSLYRFSEGKAMPPLLYAVNRNWAADKQHGLRLSHALVEAHKWLFDPANKVEAMAILKKYNKKDDKITEESYDVFLGNKDALMNVDGAVDLAGLNTEVALMVANGALPAGTTLTPDQFMLPKDQGGLYH